MKRESRVAQEIERELCGPGSGLRLWNNPVGHGLSGKIPNEMQMAQYKRLIGALPDPSDMSQRTANYSIVFGARRIQYGLKVGSSDKIGIKKITITPEMVGSEIGVFVGVEVKKEGWRPPGKSKHHQDQLSWARLINSFGGVAGIVSSAKEAKGLILDYIDGLKNKVK